MPGLVLVIGGARSGKSAYAEARARASGLARVYIATAAASDDEMAERIARHRADRAGEGWDTIEEQRALPAAITRMSHPERVVLVDCLTLWLSNLLLAGEDVARAEAALLASLRAASGPVIVVSNEVGMGLVPETPLGRAFRDAQGRLNQSLARIADHAVFVAAGLPLALKGAL